MFGDLKLSLDQKIEKRVKIYRILSLIQKIILLSRKEQIIAEITEYV